MAGTPNSRTFVALAPLLSHATARPRQASTSFVSQAKPAGRRLESQLTGDLSTLRPGSLPSRSGRTVYSKSQLGGYFACSQPTGDAESYFGCRVRPPGRCCSCSGRALRPVSPGSDLIRPASMRVSRPAELRDGSAGQRLVQRHLGQWAVRRAAQMVLGWRRPRSPARCSGRRWHPESLRLLPPPVFTGDAERGRPGEPKPTVHNLRSRRWLGGIDPRLDRRLAAAGLACRQPAVAGDGRGRRRPGGCRRSGAGLPQRGCGDRPGGAALQPG